MAKSGGYKSSANTKKDLKKAQFDMSGVFFEAPTVKEQFNIVRKQQAYGQNLDQKSEMEMQIAQKEAEVAGLQRAQQGQNVSSRPAQGQTYTNLKPPKAIRWL